MGDGGTRKNGNGKMGRGMRYCHGNGWEMGMGIISWKWERLGW